MLNFLQSKNTDLARKEKPKLAGEIKIKNRGKETLLIDFVFTLCGMHDLYKVNHRFQGRNYGGNKDRSAVLN